MTIVSANIHTNSDTEISHRVYKSAKKPWVAIAIGSESDGTIFIEDPNILKRLIEVCLQAQSELLTASDEERTHATQ